MRSSSDGRGDDFISSDDDAAGVALGYVAVVRLRLL